MNQKNDIEQVWHNDNHLLRLRINKADLEIYEIFCPSLDDSAECKNSHGDCVVQWFISRFGMDCNGGVCAAEEDLQICWTLIGDKDNLESSQLWFMPFKDEVFQAWLISNTPSL